MSVTAHVEAMAAAELLLAPNPRPERDQRGSSLYFYARETTGVALTLEGRVHTPSNGPGSIAHVPTGSETRCECGRVGCLETVLAVPHLRRADRSLGSVGAILGQVLAPVVGARKGTNPAHARGLRR